MNVNIFRFVEIGRNFVLLCHRSHITDRNHGGFFHHIAERTGRFDFSRSFEDGNLDLEERSAEFGVSQSVHTTNLVDLVNRIGQKLSRTEIALHVGGIDDNLLGIGLREQNFCGFATNFRNRTFKVTHTGFSRIVIYNFCQSTVRKFQDLLADVVQFQLFRNEMTFRNFQFFPLRINPDFDNFHTVYERFRYVREIVCGRNEHTTGQIEGEFYKMVTETFVLLTVQNFEHGGCRIAVCVTAHFVDFVKQDQGIANACLRKSRNNPPGHCTDIGFAVTSDVRLVTHTAEGNANVFAVQRMSNRRCD